jgi:type VI secretion system protein ImpL
MLGSAGPLTASLVRAWLQADWEARFPGTLNAPLRERLLHHLDALLAEPLPQVTLDGALVEGAQDLQLCFSGRTRPQPHPR